MPDRVFIYERTVIIHTSVWLSIFYHYNRHDLMHECCCVAAFHVSESFSMFYAVHGIDPEISLEHLNL